MCTWSSRRVEGHGAPYELFGIFAVINYIIPYFMWSPSSSSNYTLLICLRLVAGVMCFLLIIKDYWSDTLVKYLPLYWHLTLLYCLPFLTTLMLFDSQGESFWLLNMIIALLLLAVLVDWQSFIIILVAGVGLGYGFFIAIGESAMFSLSTDTLYWTSYMCFFSVLIGILFSRRNEKIAREKLNAYKSVSTSIAHEMRTPLSAMFISAQGVQQYLPHLLQAYDVALANKLDIPKIEERKLQILQDFPNHFISISRRSLSVIDIFLTKFGIIKTQDSFEQKNSIINCIRTAVSEYPFYPEEQSGLIEYQKENDFLFCANESLVIHIFYNLIKNSLQQIQRAQRGKIKIWLGEVPGYNVAYFKDTAVGIKAEDMPKIFDRFYTDTNHGTGIGLAYCKDVMTSFGGKITCESSYGEYAEFQLYFPK